MMTITLRAPLQDSVLNFPLEVFAVPVAQKPKAVHPRGDSNPQSSAPETDALSIWPLGLQTPPVGLEPTISPLGGVRLIH